MWTVSEVRLHPGPDLGAFILFSWTGHPQIYRPPHSIRVRHSAVAEMGDRSFGHNRHRPKSGWLLWLVSWSLMSLFSTNMAISETRGGCCATFRGVGAAWSQSNTNTQWSIQPFGHNTPTLQTDGQTGQTTVAKKQFFWLFWAFSCTSIRRHIHIEPRQAAGKVRPYVRYVRYFLKTYVQYAYTSFCRMLTSFHISLYTGTKSQSESDIC